MSDQTTCCVSPSRKPVIQKKFKQHSFPRIAFVQELLDLIHSEDFRLGFGVAGPIPHLENAIHTVCFEHRHNNLYFVPACAAR